MRPSTILVVDDVPRNRRVLSDRLRAEGHDVFEAVDGDEALRRARAVRPDLILLDILLPGIDGYEVLRRAHEDEDLKHTPIVVVSAVDDLGSVARCLELGAEDYLTKPIEPTVLRARVHGCLEKKRLRDQERACLAEIAEANATLEQRVAERTARLSEALDEVERLKERVEAENACLRQEIEASRTSEEMIGQSTAFRRVLTTAERVAPTDATVLILGETGTGKELLARAIHEMSGRHARDLITVNCGSLPPSLIESELFGHERGAFTGAVTRRIGRFELADGGTVFLDEIGDLPFELQAKLLRVLQEGTFERLGGTTTITVDTRVIAATNRELERHVAEGTFREDLYYRLNVIPLRCPPLRERRDDIPLLVHHLVTKHCKRLGRTASDVPLETMRRLQAHRWPGNIRELENTIERAVILSSDGTLEIQESAWPHAEEPGDSHARTLEDKQREYIIEVLEQTGWRIRGAHGAAVILGVKPTTLEARMKRLGVVRREPHDGR